MLRVARYARKRNLRAGGRMSGVQLSLDEFVARQPSRTEQGQNLHRVVKGIGAFVLEFCRARTGQTFTAAELHAFVAKRSGRAPASADRILRALRQAGVVDVRLVSRSASLYLVAP
jgi:hypothetical protein